MEALIHTILVKDKICENNGRNIEIVSEKSQFDG